MRKSKGYEAEKNHPGLPAVELIDSIDDRSHEKLDS